MLAALEKKQQTQKAKQDSKPVIVSGGFWMPLSLLHSWLFISILYPQIIQT